MHHLLEDHRLSGWFHSDACRFEQLVDLLRLLFHETVDLLFLLLLPLLVDFGHLRPSLLIYEKLPCELDFLQF